MTPEDMGELVLRARLSVAALRDQARTLSQMPFQERDQHVMAIHRALDAALAQLRTSPPEERPALDFGELQQINRQRCEAAFHSVEKWAPWEWSNAMAGECGEACNLTKKMARIWPANEFKQNWNKSEDQRMADLEQRLASELGDVVIYADLLATRIGRNLGECVRESFNNKSDEIGSPIKLAAPGPEAPPPGLPKLGVNEAENAAPKAAAADPVGVPVAAELAPLWTAESRQSGGRDVVGEIDGPLGRDVDGLHAREFTPAAPPPVLTPYAECNVALADFERLTVTYSNFSHGGIEAYVTRSDAQHVLLHLRHRLRDRSVPAAPATTEEPR